LDPGRYIIEGSAPAYVIYSHQIRIWNVSDNVVALLEDLTTEFYGTSEYTNFNDNVVSRSFFQGYVSLSSQTTFRIEHFTTLSWVTGFGLNAGNSTTDVYTIVKITKIAD